MTALFDWILALLLGVVGALFSFLSSAVLSFLSLDESMTEFFRTFPLMNDTYILIKVVALVLIGALLLYQLVQSMLTPNPRTAENPFALFARAGVATLLVTYGDVISRLIIRIGTAPYNAMMTLEITNEVGGGNQLANIGTTIGHILGTFAVDFALGGLTTVAYGLISLVLVVALLIAYVKLLIEVFERYITLGIIIVFSPLVMATTTSRNTLYIFVSWFKMLISQVILMFMSVVFLRGFDTGLMYLMVTKWESGQFLIIYILMLIALVKTGSAIDRHMATLGLTTAQGGGNLGAEIIGAAHYGNRLAGRLLGGLYGASGVRTGSEMFGNMVGYQTSKTARAELVGRGLADGKSYVPTRVQSIGDAMSQSPHSGVARAGAGLNDWMYGQTGERTTRTGPLDRNLYSPEAMKTMREQARGKVIKGDQKLAASIPHTVGYKLDNGESVVSGESNKRGYKLVTKNEHGKQLTRYFSPKDRGGDYGYGDTIGPLGDAWNVSAEGNVGALTNTGAADNSRSLTDVAELVGHDAINDELMAVTMPYSEEMTLQSGDILQTADGQSFVIGDDSLDEAGRLTHYNRDGIHYEDGAYIRATGEEGNALYRLAGNEDGASITRGSLDGFVGDDGNYYALPDGKITTNAKGQVLGIGLAGSEQYIAPQGGISPEGQVLTQNRSLKLEGDVVRTTHSTGKPLRNGQADEFTGIANKEGIHRLASIGRGYDRAGNVITYDKAAEGAYTRNTSGKGAYVLAQDANGNYYTQAKRNKAGSFGTHHRVFDSVAGIRTDAQGNIGLNGLSYMTAKDGVMTFTKKDSVGTQHMRARSMAMFDVVSGAPGAKTSAGAMLGNRKTSLGSYQFENVSAFSPLNDNLIQTTAPIGNKYVATSKGDKHEQATLNNAQYGFVRSNGQLAFEGKKLNSLTYIPAARETIVGDSSGYFYALTKQSETLPSRYAISPSETVWHNGESFSMREMTARETGVKVNYQAQETQTGSTSESAKWPSWYVGSSDQPINTSTLTDKELAISVDPNDYQPIRPSEYVPKPHKGYPLYLNNDQDEIYERKKAEAFKKANPHFDYPVYGKDSAAMIAESEADGEEQSEAQASLEPKASGNNRKPFGNTELFEDDDQQVSTSSNAQNERDQDISSTTDDDKKNPRTAADFAGGVKGVEWRDDSKNYRSRHSGARYIPDSEDDH